MSFCTAVNCMEGQAQEPVLRFLRRRFKADHVDTITELGPNRLLATGAPAPALEALLRLLDVSVNRHFSKGLAIVGHEDCEGNGASKAEQFIHLRLAAGRLAARHPELPVAALWVDRQGRVEEIAFRTLKSP